MSAAATAPDPPETLPARLDALRDGLAERSMWRELATMLPDVARLLRQLVVDPRVPVRAKVLAGAAAVYVTVPVDPFPEVVPGTGVGVDDLVAVLWAMRRLVASAGYDVVRELWAGTEAGFVLLMLFTGVEA